MEEDAKKISFSFKQVTSKPKVVPVVSKSNDEKIIDFIECVEEKAIKVIGLIEKVDHELIIPMQSSVKRHLPVKFINSKENNTENKSFENGIQTLDELAVQSILAGCQKKEIEKDDLNTIELPMIVNPPEGKEVSTLEDYENIPVDKFGLAMLRGMGWKSDVDANKNSKSIASLPEVRPRGMGLGADKLITHIQNELDTEEKLGLKDGSYVQFIIGRLNGQYGQVKGFDEGDSRVMVKIAQTGQIVKVNENSFHVVTKSNYDKNSKVINIKEYHEYHKNQKKSDGSEVLKHERKSKRDVYNDHRSKHHKTKKSKHSKSPHRKYKSDYNRHKKYKNKRSSS